MTALHTGQYKRFADALAQARRDAGLSQDDLADRLGVQQSFVSKYETARRRLDVIEFLRVAAAIGIEPAKVLSAVGSDDLGDFPQSEPRRGRRRG